MRNSRIGSIFIILFAAALAYSVVVSEPKLKEISRLPARLLPQATSTQAFFAGYPFRLGLDLSGGTHLTYKADIADIKPSDVSDSMDALRDVIERRVNLFGVSEPLVQREKSSIADEERLIVDLPGVTNIDEAVKNIGQTPVLEFKLERPAGAEKDAILKAREDFKKAQAAGGAITISPLLMQDPYYVATDLTGRFLQKSQLEFDQTTRQPTIALVFNDEGGKMFADITKNNVGKQLAIYLDGSPISAPVIREEITGGRAVISGEFTPADAKVLVGRLNAGALPVPISLIGSQVVGATLGEKAVQAGARAALIGFALVSLFLILWYRLPGLVAVLALLIYVVITLVLFKLIPVTLTAAGIAGFILSVGMAVDANILIAERTKEELRSGKNIPDAIQEGFTRAWASIRDSNISSIITGVMLFWFGSSLIQGFAFTFVLGVLVSMFSAITVTRTFLLALGIKKRTPFTSFLFSSGLNK